MKTVSLLILATALSAFVLTAQRLPGLPSKGTKADVQPPVVKVQTGVETPDASASHQAALSDLQVLIEEAQRLREELTAAGPDVLTMASVKRSEQVEKLARRVRKQLKRK